MRGDEAIIRASGRIEFGLCMLCILMVSACKCFDLPCAIAVEVVPEQATRELHRNGV